jgi:hypothetical protein
MKRKTLLPAVPVDFGEVVAACPRKAVSVEQVVKGAREDEFGWQSGEPSWLS